MAKEEEAPRKVSRRQFVKGAAVGGAGVAAAGMLASCAPAPVPTTAPGETAAPAPTCPPAGECPPCPVAGVPETWDEETDVVVVGSGDAGLCATIEAFDGGASVIMVEKASFIGGNSRFGGGNAQFVQTHVQEAQGIEDHIEWGIEDQWEMGDHRAHPDLLRLWAEQSEPTVTWFEEMGLVWGKVKQQEGARVARSHRPGPQTLYPIADEERGLAYVILLTHRIEERDIPMLLEHKLTRIYREPDGPVLGIETETPQGTVNIKARKAVILASGGFKANHQMLRALCPSMDEDLKWSGYPYVNTSGDGHIAAMNIGGGMVDASYLCEFSANLGTELYCVWHEPMEETLRQGGGLPDSPLERMVFVENDGHRYFDESSLSSGHTHVFTNHMKAYLNLPKRPRAAWAIVDQDSATELEWNSEENLAQFAKPDPTVSPCLQEGLVAMADTIAELAGKMGVPAANLEETVSRYNGFAAAGVDEDFNRPAPMYPITTPPFFAARLIYVGHDQSTGLRINTEMQVLDQTLQGELGSDPSVAMDVERVIPHLYAAGESTGGTFGAVRGSGKRSAYMIHGRIAGQNAAKETSWE